MSLKNQISKKFPRIDTSYLSDNPSSVLRSQIETILNGPTDASGFQRMKNLIETEDNLMERGRINSMTPKSNYVDIAAFQRNVFRNESTRG